MNDILAKLTSLNRDELNIVARKLSIRGFRRKTIEVLTADICALDEGRVRKALSLSWWDLHQAIIGVVGTSVTILAFIVGVLLWRWPYAPTRSNSVVSVPYNVLPNKEQPIVLSSDRIDLGVGTRRAINNFIVRNIGEVDLYEVTIKLVLDSSALSITNDDIRVEMLDHPPTPELPLPVSGDPFHEALVAYHADIIPGRDEANHEALWITIYHLPPKTSAGFRVRNQSFVALPPGAHCLLASVAFFTNALPATFMFADGAPGIISARSDAIGMKSIGPGRGFFIASARLSEIDGAEIVTNATSLLMAGKLGEAEQECTRAIQRNPSLGVAYDCRTVVRLKQGKLQDAYHDSVKALSLLPEEPLSYEHCAQCLRYLGRLDESLTNYTKAISLSGTNMPSRV